MTNPAQRETAARALERSRVMPRPLVALALGGLLAVTSLSWCGCVTGRRTPADLGPAYQPSNFYRASTSLPLDIRRVAMLPLSVENSDWQADAGKPELEKVLRSELNKTRAFEVVAVTPEQMQAWTRRAQWRADELLPADFLGQARQALACDAILFAHLRPYHAYAPLVIGWNLKLVDARTGTILWSADEVFDAAEAKVSRAAQDYQRHHGQAGNNGTDASLVLSSPRQFGQYTLSALFGTMPVR